MEQSPSMDENFNTSKCRGCGTGMKLWDTRNLCGLCMEYEHPNGFTTNDVKFGYVCSCGELNVVRLQFPKVKFKGDEVDLDIFTWCDCGQSYTKNCIIENTSVEEPKVIYISSGEVLAIENDITTTDIQMQSMFWNE